MICPNCGNSNNDDNRFCMFCGKPVSSKAGSRRRPPAASDPVRAGSSQKRPKDGRNSGISGAAKALVVIAVICAALAAGTFLLQDRLYDLTSSIRSEKTEKSLREERSSEEDSDSSSSDSSRVSRGGNGRTDLPESNGDRFKVIEPAGDDEEEPYENIFTLSGSALDFDDSSGIYVAHDDTDEFYVTSDEDFKEVSWSVVTPDDVVLYSGASAYNDPAVIRNEGLMYGINHLCLTGVYKDGSRTGEEYFAIFSNSPANFEKLDLGSADSDGDGLTDEYELTVLFTDPAKPDTDENGLSDGEEDPDEDGLSNILEAQYGCQPYTPDTDYDGLSDGKEVALAADPLNPDTDGDGALDGTEVDAGLNPLDPRDGNTSIARTVDDIDAGACLVDITFNSGADTVDSFTATALPEGSVLSAGNIPGMIGEALSFELEGDLDYADVTVTLDPDETVPGKNYVLCYFNHDTAAFEPVESQSFSSGIIKAQIEHFSEYAVIAEDSLEEANEALLDPPAATLKEYYPTYEEYLAAVYPGKDIVSVHVNCPIRDDGTGGIETLIVDEEFSAGHTWTSIVQNGNMDTAGLVTDAYDLLCKAGAVLGVYQHNGIVKTTSYWYKTFWDVFQVKHTYDELHAGAKLHPESKEALFSLPLLISDPDKIERYWDFVSSYDRFYNLRNNNCTHFAMQCLEYMGVSHDLHPVTGLNVYERLLDLMIKTGLEEVNKTDVLNTLGFALFYGNYSPGGLADCMIELHERETVVSYISGFSSDMLMDMYAANADIYDAIENADRAAAQQTAADNGEKEGRDGWNIFGTARGFCGTIVDKNGDPVENAAVYITDGLNYVETSSDSEGRFYYEGLDAGDYAVLAETDAGLDGLYGFGFVSYSGGDHDIGAIEMGDYADLLAASEEYYSMIMSLLLAEGLW